MKKNIIIAVLATIVIGFVALMIYGWVLTTTETSVSVPSSLVQSDVQYESTGTAKREYMAGCNEDGTRTAYCECTWSALTANYTIKQIAEFGEEYNRTGNLTDEMWQVIEACY